MEKPVLSIGIIFKNEIRCLERCLKSLQALRAAVPCEVVMADTGADDGSREIAEKYADILFDFPWINDFAAARNAVMDRCSGEWYLSIDADEWLEDIAPLLDFLRAKDRDAVDLVILVIRNYMSKELGPEYTDFQIGRLARMAAGVRYEGTIHECMIMPPKYKLLTGIILHHDGYAYSSQEEHKKKMQRNMGPLRKELAKNPEDIRLLTLCMENGTFEPDLCDFAHRTVNAVLKKVPGWQQFGPSALSDTIKYAQIVDLPELEEWISLSEELFPNSLFTRIDVAYTATLNAWNKEDYPQCIRRAEGYFQALQECADGTCSQEDRLNNTLMMERPSCQLHLRVLMAGSYLRMGEPARAAEQIAQIDGTEMNAEQVKNFTLLLHELHTKSGWDTAPLITDFWVQLSAPKPTPQKASERKAALYRVAQNAFHPKAHKEAEGRLPHTLYLPLQDVCDLGRAAAILETDSRLEMEVLLAQVERWDTLPIQALTHALEHGVEFPLPAHPLNIEEMDDLATRLTWDRASFFSLAGKVLSGSGGQAGQKLSWARGIALAAVQVYNWAADDPDVEEGMFLARSFAQTEGLFLPSCYAPAALCETGLHMLPPIHRFGWWSIRAFEALDAGDAVGYTRSLRKGLDTCNSMKPVVEFLLEHTPELKAASAPAPSAELAALAEQIRTMLACFAPDDPAVAALKQSEAYQKVAYLLEG